MTSQIHLSVVRAWRFADTADRTAVTHDLTAQRALMAMLRGGGSAGRFGLPWVPFRSHFWRHQLNRSDYENTPPTQLVGSLLPRRTTFDVAYGHPATRRRPLAEVYLEPFGLWTALTVDLIGGTWESDPELVDALDTAMTTDVSVGTAPPFQLRDGFDVATVTEVLGDAPWAAIPDLRDAGSMVITSGLCPVGGDVEAEANQLRSHFRGGGKPTVNPTTRSAGATATTGQQLGIALTAGASRSGSWIKCLHHNHSLLFGHLLTLSAVAGAGAPAVASRYRDMAARQLNHFTRGEPPVGGGIYKSRATPAWVDKRGLGAAINAVTDLSPDGPLPHI